MKELYGVVGYADAPEEVIHGSLNDLKTTVNYVIPWYGIKPIPPALVAVYDWMIDNGASYEVVASTEGTPCPKIIRENASTVHTSEHPSSEIIEFLAEASPAGFALVMWNQDDPEDSLSIASACISRGIPTLELTAGLSPIIMDEDEVEIVTIFEEDPVDLKDMPKIDPTEWDEETLDIMPAASVKKMARDAGHNVKTKSEAIRALKGKSAIVEQDENGVIGGIIITLSDGSQLSFSVNQKLLKEVLDVVVKYQSSM